jgi:hypothetical protein
MLPTTTTPVWIPIPIEIGTRSSPAAAICALRRSTARAISIAEVTARSAWSACGSGAPK